MIESSSQPPCWIDAFVSFSEGLSTPRPFRLWTAIGCISAALERKLTATTAQGPVYPNLYILLTAPPGVGKSAVLDTAHSMLRATKGVYIAPDNMNKSTLLDQITDSANSAVVENIRYSYHFLTVFQSEFGVFCPAHDQEFLSVLTRIYDCPSSYSERRRHLEQKGQIDIKNPGLTLVAGVQPGYLKSMLPDVAWEQGFMSRMIMVYAGSSPDRPLFGGAVSTGAEKRKESKRLVAWLEQIASRAGDLPFTHEAQVFLEERRQDNFAPVPEHPKLKHYLPRRVLNILKFCIISAAARGAEAIDVLDCQRAMTWLLSAESTMEQIFLDMRGSGDYQILQELHVWVGTQANKTGKPVPEALIIAFLQKHTPAYNVPNLLKTAKQSDLIRLDKSVKGPRKGYVLGSGDVFAS